VERTPGEREEINRLRRGRLKVTLESVPSAHARYRAQQASPRNMLPALGRQLARLSHLRFSSWHLCDCPHRAALEREDEPEIGINPYCSAANDSQATRLFRAKTSS